MNFAGKSGLHGNFGSGTQSHIDSLSKNADTVTIADAHLLFSGDFARSGTDLIISDPLHRVVVPNYFNGDKRPALVSVEGAPLDPKVVDALTGHVQYAQAAGTAAAAKVVGHVVKMTGSASIVRNGVTIDVNNGDVVYQNDVVQTGSGSTLGLVMIDGTTFNLTANARLMMNDLTYDATSTSNTSLFTLVQGAATFVAGQVAKTGDMKVSTPVATMGIRGTAVILDISAIDGSVSVSVVNQRDGQIHAVQVFNARGDLIGTVSSNGTSLTLRPTATFEVIAQESGKTVAQILTEFNAFQQLLSTYEIGKQLVPSTPAPTDGRRGDNTQQPLTKFAGSTISPIDSTTTKYNADIAGAKEVKGNAGVGDGPKPTGQITDPVTKLAFKTEDGPVQFVEVAATSIPFVVTPSPVSRISSGPGDHFGPVMSADGQFVTYDPDGTIYLFDRQTGATKTIASPGGGLTYGTPTISSDGHFVVYQGSDGTQSWIFIYNNDASDPAHYGQITRLMSGGQPAISGDGSKIVVERGGSIGLYDQQGHELANITGTAVGVTGTLWKPAISGDGHIIAFWSSDLSSAGGAGQLFTYDLSTATLRSIASTATDAGTSAASFSADGHYVVYQSDAPGGHSEIYLYDLRAGQVIFQTANPDPSYNPVLSPDGHFIILASEARLTADDKNGFADIYVIDVSDPSHPAYKLVSVLDDGTQGDDASNLGAAISAGGQFVAFGSRASNFSSGDGPGTGDIFVVDPTSGHSAIILESRNSPAILTASGVIKLTGDHSGITLGVSDSRITASFDSNGNIQWSFSEPRSDFASLQPGEISVQRFVITLSTNRSTTEIPVKVSIYDVDQPVISVTDAAPVASPVTLASGTEDSSYTITAAALLAGVVDIDGPSLSITAVGIVSGGGSIVDNHNGTFSYTPAPNYNGPVVFSYTASDGTLSASSTASLNVASVNDAPVVTRAAFAVSEGGTVVLSAANIGAADLDSASFTFAVSNVTHGTFQTTADGIHWTNAATFTSAELSAGHVRFVHDGGELAPTFAVQANDGAASNNQSNVVAGSVAFANVNDAPAITTLALTIAEGGTVVLDASNIGVTDPDNNSFVFTASNVSHGTFELTANGSTWVPVTTFTTADLDAGHVRFVHDGSEDTPAFSIQANDGAGSNSLSNVFAASVTFTHANDAPLLTSATLSVAEGGTVVLSASSIGVTDPDGTSFTFTVSNLTHGKFETTTDGTNWASAITFTSADLDAGHVRFVHDGGEDAPTFSLQADDGAGSNSLSNVLAGSVSFTNVNDAPVVSGANTGTVHEDDSISARTITGQFTATDPDDSAAPTWTIHGGTTPHTAQYSFRIDEFKVVRTGIGSFTFDDSFDAGNAPSDAPNFSGGGAANYGTTGSFVESHSDGGFVTLDAAHSVITNGVGTAAEIGGNFATLQTGVGAGSNGLRLASDFTVEGTFDLINPAELRQEYGIRLTDRTGGTAALLGNDTLDLVVRYANSGVVAVQLRHLDQAGNVATTLESITLDSLNPTAQEDHILLRLSHAANSSAITASFDLYAGNAYSRTVSFTTTDDIFHGEDFTRASFFAAAFNPSVSYLSGNYGTLSIDSTGVWNYSLNNGSNAVQSLAEGQTVHDIFTVDADDGHPGGVGQRTIDVSVVGVNDAPVVTSAALSVSQGGTVVLSASNIGVTDPDGTSFTFTASNVSHGTFQTTVNGITWVPSATFTAADLNAGHVRFVHDGGEDAPTFSIQANDGAGSNSLSNVLAGSVSFTNLNDAPVVTITPAQPADVTEDGTLTSTITVSASDPDLGDVAHYDMTGWTPTALINDQSFGGHFYRYVPSAVIDWTSARAQAVALGGHLANITSAAENSFIQNSVKPHVAAWIGASDAAHEGIWTWADGPEAGQTFWLGDGNGAAVTYANWWGTEPNGGVSENYGFIDQSGVWTDVPVTNFAPQGFIVEFDDFASFTSYSLGNPYGNAVFNTTTGELTFNLDNGSAAVQSLAAGEHRDVDVTVVVKDQSGAATTATATFGIDGVNDAPVVDAATLAAVAEDTANPAGQTVGTLFAGKFHDIDNGSSLAGIAVVANHAAPGQGAWQYMSVASGMWENVGTVSETEALAFGLTTKLRFVPGPDFNGTPGSLEVRGLDDSYDEEFTVGPGGRYTINTTNSGTDPLGHGGSTPISDLAVTLSTSVTPVNDAPVVSGTNTGTVHEDDSIAARTVTHQFTATDPDVSTAPTWVVHGGTTPHDAQYSFRIDEFKVTRTGAGAFTFDDSFDTGNAPSDPTSNAPNFSGGGAASYGATGSFVEDHANGGSVTLDAAHAVITNGVGTATPVEGNFATLQTNIAAGSTNGLRLASDFTVEGTFDLINPAELRQEYGIRLTDRTGTVLGNDTLDLVVRNANSGVVAVQLRHLDQAGNVSATLQSITLNPTAQEDHILLRLSHAANSSAITASFDLYAGSVYSRTVSFTTTDDIFRGEDFTRASFFAAAPSPSVSYLSGSYGTLSIDSTGEWSYSLNNGASAVQSLSDGQTVHDIFTVDADDGQPGGIGQRTVDISVVGVNDAPVVRAASGDSAGTATPLPETDLGLSASGTSTVNDADLNDTVTLSVSQVSATGPTGGIAIPQGSNLDAVLKGFFSVTAGPLAANPSDLHNVNWSFNSGSEAFNYLAAGDTLTLTYTIRPDDGHTPTGTGNGTVTIRIAGTNDAPVIDLDPGTPGTGYTVSLTADGNPFPIAVSPSVSDVDGITISGATVVLTDGIAGDFFYLPGGGTSGSIGDVSWEISGTAGDADHPLTITFSGSDLDSGYANAIQQVSFGSTSTVAGTRHIAVQVDDGAANKNLSNVAVAAIDVAPVNAAPVVTAQAAGNHVLSSSGGDVPGRAAYQGVEASGLGISGDSSVTVEFWLKDSTEPTSMAVGFFEYDLLISNNSDGTSYIGFNTGQADNYYTTRNDLQGQWHHVTAVFATGNVLASKLYIDGVLQTLQSTGGHANYLATPGDTIHIGGWGVSTQYTLAGQSTM